MLRYTITSQNPASHYFNVCLYIDNPNPTGQCLRLPNWIPGSYMIRDFSRHLIDLRASCEGNNLVIDQLDKSNWRLEPAEKPVVIEYRVYARDLSVRGAHLDHLHGYYNGTSVFLEVVGQADTACEVNIEKPAQAFCRNWRLATTLPVKTAEPFGFGLYQADDYDELIDHPVEMGEFRQIRFEACGIPHDIILSGRFDCDEARLADDLTRICEHHIRFFGEPAPMNYYQFQVLVVGDGYGGLEHRSSTSLMCSRDSLPQTGDDETTDSYRDFLGLCSHEYFHTWNVKRIKPAVYEPYHLQSEVYSELLWAFEGITSYYDDLALVRCGLIETQTYLELLAQTATRVLRGKGATRQSAAESSFNTWTKFYKQDENAANAIVSYYAKGSLIALCIDLKIRSLTAGDRSLDNVMQVLWQRWQSGVKGVEDNDIQQIVNELCQTDLSDFLNNLIHQTGPLPLEELLADVGVSFQPRFSANQNDKGGKVIEGRLPGVAFGAVIKEDNGNLRILRVDEDGAAQSAGLNAEDAIIAVNGLRPSMEKFERQLLLASPGDCWQIHAFRRDELYEFEVTLAEAVANTIVLQIDASEPTRHQRWLHQN